MSFTPESIENTEKMVISLSETIVSCRKCPRLVEWREKVAKERRKAYRDEVYWGKPVPGFGDIHGRVLAVGLAPGAHGGNRTGRMFTGDGSGEFLYETLFRAGFANQPDSHAIGDGLALSDLYISAICRCAPPGNKPKPGEIASCLPYLQTEMGLMKNLQVVVALGKIAFDGVLRIVRQKVGEDFRSKDFNFGHGVVYRLGDGLPWLIASYHPSRQNTQTGRLTKEMFDEVWITVSGLLD
jgi:uracil-DNA glycosylase